MNICYSATVLQFVFALLTPNIVYRNIYIKNLRIIDSVDCTF